MIDAFFESDFKKIGYLITEIDGKLNIPEKKIQKEWHTATYEIMFLIANSIPGDCLHSIYLRGSVAQGCAIENASDIDFIVLLEKPCDTQGIQDRANELASEKYPFIKYVDIVYSSVWDINDFLLEDMQCFATHLFGTDVLLEAEDVCLKNVSVIDDYILSAMSIYGRNQSKTGCSAVMKMILRQMFGLVAVEQGVYTRSLYYCFYHLVKARPDVEDLAKKIVYLAINPSEDVDLVRHVILASLDWYDGVRAPMLGLKPGGVIGNEV